MRDDHWELEYRGVFLVCRPERVDGGYRARLVVADRRQEPHREAEVPTQAVPPFATEREAAHSVVEAGKKFVDLMPGWAGT
ncbi:hypothetical protein ABXN37_18645 [Piscinibacter sakaiensis]|uniref:Uncharacterized protein n=1 Tax=Piscinibacter sakaiensis TaxID=1547922 RepID=A0A0K8P4S9_PISS1|nr:hypothetical protein [Piscinibacter sakaiensis]GAP37155.1 hypothetical protein ISF6_3010 [Piscinibacter sakaiensis]